MTAARQQALPARNPSAQRAFYDEVASSIKVHSNARLAGSWRTGEAHMPAARGGIISTFSDVDIRTHAALPPKEIAALIDRVKTIAWRHRIQIEKVSVRSQRETDELWCSSAVRGLRANPDAAGQFLAFWALVGALEAIVLMQRCTSPHAGGYGAAKLFFKVLRNSLLLMEVPVSSYHDIARETEALFPGSPALRLAYAIKTGERSTVIATEWKTVFSQSIWRSMMSPLTTSGHWRLIDSIRTDFLACLVVDAPPPARRYLQHCERLALSPAMKAAFRKIAGEARVYLEH